MLSPRKQRILQAVVDEYVQTSVPVSSQSVAHRLPVTVSSATVRNEMAEMEEEGYVARPHASAGRVPLDKGYRAYVAFLGEVPEPPAQARRLIRLKFRNTPMEMEAWSRMASQLLAGLAHTMAICTLPRVSENRWKHLDMVQVNEFLALLIMVLQESRLKQQLTPIKEPVTQDQLTHISNKLNTVYSGLSSSEIRRRIVELTPLENELAEGALGLLNDEPEENAPDYHMDGLRHLFGYPELTPGSRVRELTEVLEDPHFMRSLLAEAFPEAGGVRVAIGRENRTETLHAFSVVFAQYGVPSEVSGVVGVLGPTRMEYANAISSVRYLASVMTQMLEMVQGKTAG